jgi:hypothetical protein
MPGARSRRTSTPRTFLKSTLDDMEGWIDQVRGGALNRMIQQQIQQRGVR